MSLQVKNLARLDGPLQRAIRARAAAIRKGEVGSAESQPTGEGTVGW
jgi:hypothetical protein